MNVGQSDILLPLRVAATVKRRVLAASRFSKAATGEDLKSLLKVLDVVYFCTTLVGGFTLLFNDIVPLSLLMSGPTFYCMLLAMFKL